MPLGGGRVEVRDGGGAVVASALLGDAPWPGSEALYWAEIALQAPAAPGPLALTAHFERRGHRGAARTGILGRSASTWWRAPSTRSR